MKAFVITIDSLEESVGAARRCIRSGARYGVEVENFTATTPADNPEEMFAEKRIPTQLFAEKYSRWENVLSCFMSHHRLWEKCVELNEPILILEHDAVFVNELPPNILFSGVLSFGAPSYGRYNTPKTLGKNKLTSKPYLPGAHAYGVTPWAAKHLIDRARQDACPTDVFIGIDRFGRDLIEEYYPFPVEARDSFSTVQKTEGCLAKHSYQKSPETFDLVDVK